MLPSNTLSTLSVPGEFLEPDNNEVQPLIARERGGVDIQDPSQGLQLQNWTARYIDGQVVLGSASNAEQPILTRPGIVEIDLTFDQNMNPAIAFTEVDENQVPSAFLWWFDTTVNQYVFINFPGAYDLRVSMDDKRELSDGQNDIILIYLRDNDLFFRAQRDRFLIEYLLRENLNGRLKRFGMNDGLRMQIEFLPFEDTPDILFIIEADNSYEALPEFFSIEEGESFIISADDEIESDSFDLLVVEEDITLSIPNEDDPCL